MRGSTPTRTLIGRTVSVSRPSMRGSPSRIWLRTIFDSSPNRISPTRFESSGVSSPAFTCSISLARISSRRVLRACFWRRRYASRRSLSASSAMRPTSSSSFSAGFQSHAGLAAMSASSLIAWIAACICSCPNTTEPSITSSESSFASDSTISTACSVPATTRLRALSLSWVAVGLSTYSPLI